MKAIKSIFLAILCVLPAANAASADNYSKIEFYSKIKIGDADKLEDLLKQHGQQAVVYFNSIGGHSLEAIRLGAVLRKYGAATYLPPDAQCISACFLAFIGGQTRTIAPSAKIGSHQSFWEEGNEPEVKVAVSAAQNIASKSLSHILQMGVDPEAFSLILGTPPDKMYLFSPEEQANYKITGTDSGRKVFKTAKKSSNLGQ